LAVYLNEDFVGFDAALVGFPHLVLCMGLVYVTPGGLHGVHLTGINHTDATVAAFDKWMTGRSVDRTGALALFGSCNVKERYKLSSAKAAADAWKAEVTKIAGVLGYSGEVRGFDTSIIHPKDGTYVEYHNDPHGNCRIYYKRNEKMSLGTPEKAQDIGWVRRGAVTTGPIVVMPKSAGVVATKSNKGLLHEVDLARRLMKVVV